MTEQTSPQRRFWLGGKRADEQDRFFREALEALGWRRGDDTRWEAAWITGMPDAKQFRQVSPQRRMNHFPGNAALTVKSRLHASLAALRERMQQIHGADSEWAERLAFFPRSYEMPQDYHTLQVAAREAPQQRWILKPTNASKGKGIQVLQRVAEAPLKPDWLVQEYLANPHTIRGHKYVLRLYVLISSIEPLRVYLYRQGFAKLASEPWDPDDVDNPFSQLTNPDINALNTEADVPVEFIDLERYRDWLREQGHDDAQLFAKIEDLVALTAISALDAIKQRTAQAGADPRGCYELLGLDCLVDDTLKPWILECNLSPSLGTCAAPESGGVIEEEIKGGLVRDMLRLLGIGEPQAAGDDSPLAETQAEQARAGSFQRLLPASEQQRYLPYFSLPAPADLQLADAMSGERVARPQLMRRHVAELFEGDQLALYATHTHRYYRPNDTAALIWLLASEGFDPDTIADQLARSTGEDHSALRDEVWSSLAGWCREGLLCQQGAEGEIAAVAPAARMHDEPQALQLGFDGKQWALHLHDAPALDTLTMLFAGALVPLSDSSALRLPRLEVLKASAGYSLAANGEMVAARLTLAQLGPALLGYLMRQALLPGRQVLDAGLLITPGGTGVLCLFPIVERAEVAQRLVSATQGVLSRGVRLTLGETPRVEPLGLPIPDVISPGLVDVPGSIALEAVLCSGEDGVSHELSEIDVLDALGDLLPCCLFDDDAPAGAATVVALNDWLAGLSRRAMGTQAPSFTALSHWLKALEAGERLTEQKTPPSQDGGAVRASTL
ncbi:amylase [Halomonas sp. ML-15]|uniref:PqqD family peptide modification chaperone n=1 Tax=Halomonas sp. ML-15 TaxID=2773305 RepID=UPI001746B617|nr:PqqD family peptide modification chaperone [Halomonas sp. ML-15]MBD3895848.1 amylase [Halomonas sp. ML-15]